MLSIDQTFSKDVAHLLWNGVVSEKAVYAEIGQAFQMMNTISQLERPMREELERLAISIVKDNFQIFQCNEHAISIDAKLVDKIEKEEDGNDPLDERLMPEYRKRKVINMMTQGASINTHGIHHLDDDFRQKNTELVQAYDVLDRVNRKMMRSMPDEFLFDQTISNSNMLFSYPGRVHLEHAGGKWIIHAQATMMPILIHEIVKGLYELIAMYGLPKDRPTCEKVFQCTDSIQNELMDCKYGEVLYALFRDNIRNTFPQMTDRKPELLEYFLQSLYELPAEQMLIEVEAIVSGKMDIDRTRRRLDDIYRDL